MNFEVLCKWDVWCRDWDAAKMLESRDEDGTEMFKKCLKTISRPRRSWPRLQPWYFVPCQQDATDDACIFCC